MAEMFRRMSRRRQYQFLLLLGLTLVSSVSEVVSLGSVVPFIGILTQPERAFNYAPVVSAVRALGLTAPEDLVLPLTLFFAVAALVAGALRVLLLWAAVRLSTSIGIDFSVDIYRRTLYQPYRVHVSRNSSDVISGLTQKISLATNVLISAVTAVTSAMLFVAIVVTLLAIDPVVATVAMVTLGAGYAIIGWQTRQRLVQNSEVIAQTQTTVIKALQEGLGAIRDVLLDGTQGVYCEAYGRTIGLQYRAWSQNVFLSQAPRFAMETMGMVLVAAFALVVSRRTDGVAAALPLLAALGLGAQRLLPLLQQLYVSWAVVAGGKRSLSDVLDLLDQPLPAGVDAPDGEPLGFDRAIRLQQVRFRYSAEGPWILNDVNLTIRKGERVGFVGSTGSGKSTALDLLMSLLEPTEGVILADDVPIGGEFRRAWQRSIAHVPQHLFLADTTIAENIALGVPLHLIDRVRVREAARQAQIADFIEGCSEGYDTVVGERGVRISGGQRQRIGIARALYKRATVLVFDEATSALDMETEAAVMKSLENLDRRLTILIVAHRVASLEQCDAIVQLERGHIVARGSYQEYTQLNPVAASAY